METINKVLAPQESPPPVSEKAPEQSGSANARQKVAQAADGGSYGDPVLEWRRPGGSDLAIIGQGSQADLSLPPSCVGVSYSKAKQHGSHHSPGRREAERGSVGIDASRGNRRPSWTNERIFGFDGCGSLGQAVGAQGVLTQPE